MSKSSRQLNALKADVLFQFKHGFYYIYIVLTIMYIVVLGLFDQSVVKVALPIVIYTDPSVLGMFFIGGMVMLEKEQGILSLLYVTPLSVKEYMVSKLLSLGFISILAGIAISATCFHGAANIMLLLIGIVLTSVFYTLIGFIISTGSKTVNEYLVKMVPWMLLLAVPCFAMIPSFLPPIISTILGIFPSAAGLNLIMGAYTAIPLWQSIIYILSLVIANVILLRYTQRLFQNKVMLDD